VQSGHIDLAQLAGLLVSTRVSRGTGTSHCVATCTQLAIQMGYSKLMTGATSARASTGFLQSKDQVSDPSFKSPIDRKHLADVHVHIPRLTYRGVLLKASPALIAQRGAEFANFINVLLGDGLPPALRRLRSDRLIHDFFGQRLKDYDRAREPPPSPPGLPMEPEASAEPDADHLSIGIGTALTEDSRPPSSFRLSWSIASVDFRDTSEDFPEEDESGVVDPALASHEPSAPVFSLSKYVPADLALLVIERFCSGSSESSSTIREAQAARRAMDINN
jgi:hypothetical protein